MYKSITKLPLRERWIKAITLAVLALGSFFVVGKDITHYWYYGLVGLGQGSAVFNIIHIIPMLFTAFFGYVYALILVIALFVYSLIYDINQAYMLFIYIPLIGIVYFSTRTGVFKSAVKTLVVSIGSSFLLGNVWYLIMCIPNPVGFSYLTLFGQTCLFLCVLPECLFVYYFMYFFVKYAPDNIKQIFPGTSYYVSSINEEEDYEIHPSILGRNVALGLIFDLVIIEILSLFLTYIMLLNYSLYPGLGQYIEENKEGAIIEDLHFYMTVRDYYENLDSVVGPNGRILDSLDESRHGENRSDSANIVDENGKAVDQQGYASSDISLKDPVYKFSPSVMNYSFLTELALMLFTLAIPAIVLTNYFVQRIVINPLRGLSDYMKGYVETDESERLQYVQRIKEYEPPVHDEIWDLYDSLRKLINNVEDYVEALHNQQTLETNLKIAKAANDAKSNFLSNISHEIRTPINAIIGMNEMILRESREPEMTAYARDIRDASKTLLSLINDVLDFSKIEAGMMEIIPVQYDLASTINDLYNMASVRAKDKRLEFKCEINERMPHLLLGDEIRIKQCILNILTNAVKYTTSGSVTLSVDYDRISYDDIYLVVSVKDTGSGIKPEDIEKLFTPFARIDEQKNLTVEGTGLGMSIVRNLLNNMGSELEVDSEYGVGSTFSFRLLQRVVKWEPIGNYAMQYRDQDDQSPKYKEAYHAPDARVLVIDDTRMNLAVVKNLLKPTRIQVDMAESGQQGLDFIAKHYYDVLLIDYRMPEMNGVETLHEIRKLVDNPNRQTPAVVLTANVISGAREEYLAAGFDDYLAKPVNGELLEQTIYKYLPPEKVIRADSSDYAEDDNENSREEADHESKLRNIIEKIEGINVDVAIENCDNVNILWDALEEFYLAIKSKSLLIEKYAEVGDYRNYTILVHSLKGSARLIGAEKLSGDAAYLEDCGDHENKEEIEKLTPALVADYRAYLPQLEPIFGIQEEEDDERDELPEEEFDQALSDLKELVEAYDDTSADRILEMLKGYRIPASRQETYDKLREYMAAVDRESILSL